MAANNPMLIAAITAIPGMVAAVFAYRSSVQANRIGQRKVEVDAYDRSKAFYEGMLERAEKEISRLREQVSRLSDQLGQEQNVSQTLRIQVRDLQQTMGSMESTLAALRISLSSLQSRVANDQPDQHWRPAP